MPSSLLFQTSFLVYRGTMKDEMGAKVARTSLAKLLAKLQERFILKGFMKAFEVAVKATKNEF